MWASTLWPLASSTRNIAFGRASTTLPSISMTPSFFAISSANSLGPADPLGHGPVRTAPGEGNGCDTPDEPTDVGHAQPWAHTQGVILRHTAAPAVPEGRATALGPRALTKREFHPLCRG